MQSINCIAFLNIGNKSYKKSYKNGTRIFSGLFLIGLITFSFMLRSDLFSSHYLQKHSAKIKLYRFSLINMLKWESQVNKHVLSRRTSLAVGSSHRNHQCNSQCNSANSHKLLSHWQLKRRFVYTTSWELSECLKQNVWRHYYYDAYRIFMMHAVGIFLCFAIEIVPKTDWKTTSDGDIEMVPGSLPISYNSIRKLLFGVVSVSIFTPWLVICWYFFYTVKTSADNVPDFVYAAFLGTQLFFITFGVNSFLHNISWAIKTSPRLRLYILYYLSHLNFSWRQMSSVDWKQKITTLNLNDECTPI